MTAALATVPAAEARPCDGLPVSGVCKAVCPDLEGTAACEVDLCYASADLEAACGAVSATYDIPCGIRELRPVCSAVGDPSPVVRRVKELLP